MGKKKKNSIPPKELFANKLAKAAKGLDIGFMEATRIFKIIDPDVEGDNQGLPIPSTACWVHGKGQDWIVWNLKGVKGLSLNPLRMIIMHEALHRAGLASVDLCNKHPEVANIVFDCFINKILFNSSVGFDSLIGPVYKPGRHPEPGVGGGLLRMVLPAMYHKRAKMDIKRYRSRNGWYGEKVPLDPPRISKYADFLEIDPKWKKLHDQIWECEGLPNPMTIFYSIMQEATDQEIQLYVEGNPFSGRGSPSEEDGEGEGECDCEGECDGECNGSGKGDEEDGETNGARLDDLGISKEFKDMIEGNMDYISYDGAFSESKSSIFRKILVDAEEEKADSLKEFLTKIDTNRKLDKVLENIENSVTDQSRDPYLLNPTQDTLIHMLCGITDLTLMYDNNTGSDLSRFGLYVDTSPSMGWAKERVVYLVGEIEDMVPSELYCFSGGIYHTETKDFVDGNYTAGSSTSFDAVIEHLLESDEDGAAIFTDGLSSVNYQNQEALRESGKKIFVVYFTGEGDENGCETLDDISLSKHFIHPEIGELANDRY